MPRPRANALFELGNQWIAHDPDSRMLYRFWTEPGSGRTRRASLGTSDLGKAKLTLAEIVLQGAPKTINTPLSIVLERYFEEHSDRLPSGKVARGHGRKLLAFFGATARVKAMTEAKQKEFVQRCLDQGHKLAYAARIMVTLSSATSHSKISEPEIVYSEAMMIKRWKLASAPVEKAYIPSDEECVRLAIAPMPQMLFRFLVINALTCGRPQTAVDLAPAQFNRDAGIVDLNPAKRAQNKKFRAKVRAARVLRWLLRKWEREDLGPYGERYCGYTTMEGVKSALQRLAAETKVPASTYSWRQKATTVMRRAQVPEDQISLMLGHRRQNLRTTAGYGEWDPAYLREAAEALDAWFWQVRHAAKTMAANSQDTPDNVSVRNVRAA